MFRSGLIAFAALFSVTAPATGWAYEIKPKTPETAFSAKLQPDIVGLSSATEGSKALQALGVAATDAHGQIRPTEQVLLDLDASSKKRVFEQAGMLFEARLGLARSTIFDSLFAREKLGSTGIGQGIAIPHGKLAGMKRITGIFARLETPVDFEALDDQPVDLLFLLLAPEGAGADHLKALSRIARVLRDPDTVRKIRGTRDAAAIHALISSTPASHAA